MGDWDFEDTPPEQLVEAIHVVAGGDALLAPSITRRVTYERGVVAAGEGGDEADATSGAKGG